MRYIYPALMKQYNTYIKNTNRNALREFQLTVDELKRIPASELTERQAEFLDYYDYRMPVGTGDCVMNKICRRFEEEFDGFVSRHTSAQKFDYSIMKSDAEYSARQMQSVKQLYEEYNNRIQSYAIFADYERIDDCESGAAYEMMNEEFRKKCASVCTDESALCNIMLDLCYTKSSSKRFVWNMCGSQIIANLLAANSNVINVPVRSIDGDIEFGGERFEVEKYIIEEETEVTE